MGRRAPVVTRDQVAEEHLAAYDEVTAIRGHIPVTGPSSVLINSPEMALHANRLGEYLQNQSTLPQKIQLLAALIGARSMDCQFIWNVQTANGRSAGLSDALMDALRDRKQLPAMPADEASAVNYGLELTSTNKVKEETFQAALDQLGVQGLTEFTTSMGYFRLLALNAYAFTFDLPEDNSDPLLPV